MIGGFLLCVLVMGRLITLPARLTLTIANSLLELIVSKILILDDKNIRYLPFKACLMDELD